MTTLLRKFKLRYPVFVNPPVTEPPTPAATDCQIKYWLGDALNDLDPADWGACYEKAVLVYAAFNLAKSLAEMQNGPLGGVAGMVASASVGGESVSYTSNSRFGQGTISDDIYLLYPPYGPDFMALRDSIIPGARLTSSGPCRWGVARTWPVR